MISPPLADFLRDHRAECNARFAAARRRWPRLDGAEFSFFLRNQLAPLAAALDAASAHAVLSQGYELGLQLVAGKLAGPAAITPAINALWSTAFPTLSALIATAPRRVLGSLSNAAHHLAAHPDTRLEPWQDRLVALAPRCAHVDELLITAQVLAWRAGLAHFRVPALTAADALPPDLALDSVEAPAGAHWPQVRDAHLANPWFGFNLPARSGHCIGAFRGFGGLFLTPPLVSLSASHLLVTSGDEGWILIADAFGATLHRAAPEEIQNAAPMLPPPLDSPRLPPGHRPSSSVILGRTFAVTSAQSHRIWLGPLSPAP